MNICTCIYIYLTTISEKRGHDFEEEQGGVSIWESLEKGKWSGEWCDYIIISKRRNKNIKKEEITI